MLGRPLHDQEPWGLPVDAEFSALIATNEPVFLGRRQPPTTLLRRMKQGIAEFFRLQINQDCWKGLIEHTMDGWNIGPAP